MHLRVTNIDWLWQQMEGSVASSCIENQRGITGKHWHQSANIIRFLMLSLEREVFASNI